MSTARALVLAAIRNKWVEELRPLIDHSMIVDSEFGLSIFPADLVETRQSLRQFTWFRSSSFSQRKISEVAPHEAANVLVALARDAFSIAPEELAGELLKFLGYGRKGAEAEERARQLVAWAVREGYLLEEEGRVSAR